MMNNLKVGADPELFVWGKDGVMNAGLFTEGTKEKPEPVKYGIAVHRDNILLEFNFPPQSTRSGFVEVIGLALQQCRQLVSPNLLVMTPAVQLTEHILEGFGANAFEFRCDPEANIWGDPYYMNMFPEARSAGGHVHIGWSEQASRDEQNQLAKWCDIMIGLPLVLHEDHDAAKLRRNMYGKPGSMRYKPYGIEYRTPGNEWLRTPASTARVWDLVEECYNVALLEGRESPINSDTIGPVLRAIYESDADLAKALIKMYH